MNRQEISDSVDALSDECTLLSITILQKIEDNLDLDDNEDVSAIDTLIEDSKELMHCSENLYSLFCLIAGEEAFYELTVDISEQGDENSLLLANEAASSYAKISLLFYTDWLIKSVEKYEYSSNNAAFLRRKIINTLMKIRSFYTRYYDL